LKRRSERLKFELKQAKEIPGPKLIRISTVYYHCGVNN